MDDPAREARQGALLDAYERALVGAADSAPPPGLDPALAAVARRLARRFGGAEPDGAVVPDPAFRAALRARLAGYAAGGVAADAGVSSDGVARAGVEISPDGSAGLVGEVVSPDGAGRGGAAGVDAMRRGDVVPTPTRGGDAGAVPEGRGVRPGRAEVGALPGGRGERHTARAGVAPEGRGAPHTAGAAPDGLAGVRGRWGAIVRCGRDAGMGPGPGLSGVPTAAVVAGRGRAAWGAVTEGAGRVGGTLVIVGVVPAPTRLVPVQPTGTVGR